MQGDQDKEAKPDLTELSHPATMINLEATVPR